MVVNIEEQLRCLGNRCGRQSGMMIPQQSEIRNRLQVIQIRTCQHEEVREHLVAVPVGYQVREAIKDIIGSQSEALDNVVNLGQERFKAFLRTQIDNRHTRIVGDQRLMPGKAEIHHSPTKP